MKYLFESAEYLLLYFSFAICYGRKIKKSRGENLIAYNEKLW